MHFGTRPLAITKVDCRIEFGIGKQEGAGAVGHVYRYVRMLHKVVAQPGQQPLGAEGRYQRQFQGGGALVAHHRQGVALHRIEPMGDASAIGLAGLGQPYAPPRSAKQLNIEKAFQVGYLSAHGALGQGQFLRGLGEALVAGGGFEADQGLGWGNLAAHWGSCKAAVSCKGPKWQAYRARSLAWLFLADCRWFEGEFPWFRSSNLAQLAAKNAFACGSLNG